MSLPRVAIHTAASVDGKITIAPNVLLLYGDPRWEAVAGTSSEVYERFKAQHDPQVILEGSGSFMTEDMSPEPLPPFEGDPAALYDDFLPEAIVHRPGHRGWFTIVDGRGRWLYKEFPDEQWAGWYMLILVSRQTPPGYLAYLRRENIPYLVAGDGPQVDLRGALEKMQTRLGVERVLSTAGGRLNGALLKAGLADEVSLDIFPALIGGAQTAVSFSLPALGPEDQPIRLELVSAETLPNGHVGLRYRVLNG